MASDALTYENGSGSGSGSGSETVQYADAAGMISLLVEVTGEHPSPTEIESLPGYEMNLEEYRWDGLSLIALADGSGTASIVVTANEVAGIPIATVEGLAPGSSRAALLAANAWSLTDAEAPEKARYLGLGGIEVSGTISLARPGSVGRIFVLFGLEGDTVKEIQAPSDDFSDL